MSATPVREALMPLTGEGMVEFRPRARRHAAHIRKAGDLLVDFLAAQGVLAGE